MTTTKLFQLGSISTGTLRTEDLASTFIAWLVEHGVSTGSNVLVSMGSFTGWPTT